jgi:hypothetical protein
MATLTAVEAGASPGQEDEEMAAPVAAQETGKASPTAMEAGALSGRGNEEMAATMATQKAGRKLASPQDALNSGGSFFI